MLLAFLALFVGNETLCDTTELTAFKVSKLILLLNLTISSFDLPVFLFKKRIALRRFIPLSEISVPCLCIASKAVSFKNGRVFSVRSKTLGLTTPRFVAFATSEKSLTI